ncbi:DUF1549 domain-containing protein [Maribacter antarcticus]|uniref:DUF1549 domain-containing protein n=1 Tax=Maribacter antarcticus TaxID=505250 RepID=UPI00047EEBD4|nr:DUF1549 domain-containing protein [Maribacter antarcticus]
MEDFNWILQLLGRFHPLLVHFPIGLLVVAFFFELLSIGGKRKGLRQGTHWMLYLGTLFAILSALLGWLLRTQEDYTGELVDNHQYTGIATAVFALVTTLLLLQTLKGKLPNFWAYRVSLTITVILLSIAGHLGSSLTHGEDYLTNVLPGNQDSYDNTKGLALLTDLKASDSITLAQQDHLNLEVRAIFAHNCYQCHNENKQKGGLVLDSKEGVFKGGESGMAVVAGMINESELYRRITLSPNDDEVMPKKGKVLKDSEISLVKLWIENGAHWSYKAVKIFPEAEMALVKPELPQSEKSQPVDKLIDAYFETQGLDWSSAVEDRIFIRRAYMDVIGLLPEPEAIVVFQQNRDTDKKEKLIDMLLADTHNYTQHWISFWNDLLRNDYSGTGFITGGRKQITDWLYKVLEENKPYDEIVAELVNPVKGSEGFIKGIEWRGVVNASQRTEMQAAQNIGQSLMGANVKCASCHNSFVSNMTLDQAYGFATIFAEEALELNRCDKPIGKMAKVNFLYPELGSIAGDNVQERLFNLSKLMVKRENGRLYRTITNRFWDRLMGRGIIVPLDEMDNVPWSGELLDWLASDFIESGHDLKHLIKRIMMSNTYQLPTVKYGNKEELKSEYVFEGPVVRRLSAEQFSDAVSQVISPVYHSVAYNPTDEKLPIKRIWHPEIKFDRSVLPEPGKRYFRKTITLPTTAIQDANLLISVDHSYVLYLNGTKVLEGSNWEKVGKLNATKFLKPGENLIAIAGTNEGSIANPAGLLFSMKVAYDNGAISQIDSDTSWKSTADIPDSNWASKDYKDTEWNTVRNYGTSNWGRLINFSFEDQNGSFARASLVKQHPFMKALGRPSRENVTTSRDDQATLLQALELTNGKFFNGVLAEGATLWIDRYGNDSKKLVERLYQKSLGRNPSEEEREILLSVLGDKPKPEDVQDVFWSTLMLPEFQFIN